MLSNNAQWTLHHTCLLPRAICITELNTECLFLLWVLLLFFCIELLWLLFYCCWRDWEILFRNPLFAGAGLHSKQEKKAVETKEILVEAKIASHSQSSAQKFWSSFHLLSITQHKKVSLESSEVLLHLSTTAAHTKPSRERTVLSSPQWDTQRLCLSDNAGRWKKCFQEFQESTYAKQK